MNRLSLQNFIAQKKAVIFDLYHTLTATEITSPDGLSTATILGIEKKLWNEGYMKHSSDRLTGKITDPYIIIKEMAHAIDPSIPDELIRQAVQHRTRRFEEALVFMPESSIMTIKKLKESGKKLALLSNADKMEMSGWLKSPVKSFFDVVVFSCEAGCMKPDSQIYEICLQKLEEKPEDCFFVGDGGSDEFIGAKTMGLATVMVTGIVKNIWPERLPLIEKYADYVIENIPELVN